MFLKKKIPFYFSLLTAICGAFLTYLFLGSHTSARQAQVSAAPTTLQTDNSCPTVSVRLHGYRFIRPWMYGERECTFERLNPLQAALNRIIDSAQSCGQVEEASVYLKLMDQPDWMTIHNDKLYNPGSLLKVPIMITLLRKSEEEPGLLDKTVHVTALDPSIPAQTYPSQTIQPGHDYSVRELLRYMICYSDNYATQQLSNFFTTAEYQQTFSDLGLTVPVPQDMAFGISAKDYSVFLRVLYNSTYLFFKDSEFATGLLTQCDFQQGLLKGLPSGTLVAHKFGEMGDGKEHILSESGLVYLARNTYVITVMTRGTSMDALSGVISRISGAAYAEIAKL